MRFNFIIDYAKMKLFLYLIFTLSSVSLCAQGTLTLKPIEIRPEFDFSEEFINKFNSAEAFNDCEEVYAQMRADGRDWAEATKQELEILKYCDEIKESPWDPVGSACSWYCGGIVKSVTASSYLKSQGENSYFPSNTHDFDYKSAWVEGANGYGVGEFLLYEFPPECPRITDIIIANGYVKDNTAWRLNSRVKRLKVYYNDEPLAVLELSNIRAEQRFHLSPIGYRDRDNFELLKQKSPWTLKFEILEVYQGTKYDDTVISEIYFDGIDVH